MSGRETGGQAADLSVGIAGAGLILLPSSVNSVGGGYEWAVWALLGVLGPACALVFRTLRVGDRKPGQPPLALAAGAPRVGTLVYICGFLGGQATLATVAGRLTDDDHGRRALAAVVFVFVAVLVARSPLAFGARRVRARTAAALAASVLLAGTTPPTTIAGGTLPAAEMGVALLVGLFGLVGWEAVVGRTPRVSHVTIALAALAVAVLYGAAAAAWHLSWQLQDSAAVRAFAVSVLLAFCATNLRATGAFMHAVSSLPPRTGITLAGAVTSATAVALTAGNVSPALVLLIPGAATFVIYGLGIAAALHAHVLQRDRARRVELAPLAPQSLDLPSH